MSKSTDERGRLYLPADVRDRFGDRYRIVEFASHVGLFPVDDDPLEGAQKAVGNAFEAVTPADASDDAGDAFTREALERSTRHETDAGE